MSKKIYLLLISLVLLSSCNKNKNEIEQRKQTVINAENPSGVEENETSEIVEIVDEVIEEKFQYLWTTQKGDYIQTELSEPYTIIYVYPDVENKILESKTVQNGDKEELWYKILTPNGYEGWLKYEKQYICNQKNPNENYNAILTDYCIQNNFLVEGDEESGYKLKIGSPACLFDITCLPEIKDYANQLDKVEKITVYTKNAFSFDGSLFQNLHSLSINSKHIELSNIEKIWYLSLEEEDAVNYDFLSDCCELEDLFIYSNENIKLPDLSKLEKLSQVSILSSKQQNFDGLETIPCTFSFYMAEPSDVIMMNDVDYTALTNSNCNRIAIDFRYNQKYSQISNFVSFIEKMKNKGNFYLDIIE